MNNTFCGSCGYPLAYSDWETEPGDLCFGCRQEAFIRRKCAIMASAKALAEAEHVRPEPAEAEAKRGLFCGDGHDPSRIPEVLELLQRYWEKNPGLTLGLIVSNAARANGFSSDPLYLVDGYVMDYLRKELEEEQ